MEDLFQMALAAVFAAALLITSQFFMEYRSSKLRDVSAVVAVASQ